MNNSKNTYFPSKSEHDLRDLLTHIVICNGGLQHAAVTLGTSRGYLHDVLRGRRGVSDGLAQKLGYRAVRVFVRAGE